MPPKLLACASSPREDIKAVTIVRPAPGRFATAMTEAADTENRPNAGLPGFGCCQRTINRNSREKRGRRVDEGSPSDESSGMTRGRPSELRVSRGGGGHYGYYSKVVGFTQRFSLPSRQNSHSPQVQCHPRNSKVSTSSVCGGAFFHKHVRRFRAQGSGFLGMEKNDLRPISIRTRASMSGRRRTPSNLHQNIVCAGFG